MFRQQAYFLYTNIEKQSRIHRTTSIKTILVRSLSNISLLSLDLIFTILIYDDIRESSRESNAENLTETIDGWKTNYNYGNKFSVAANITNVANGNSHFQLLVEESQTVAIQQLHQIFIFEACGMVEIDNKLLATVREKHTKIFSSKCKFLVEKLF